MQPPRGAWSERVHTAAEMDDDGAGIYLNLTSTSAPAAAAAAPPKGASWVKRRAFKKQQRASREERERNSHPEPRGGAAPEGAGGGDGRAGAPPPPPPRPSSGQLKGYDLDLDLDLELPDAAAAAADDPKKPTLPGGRPKSAAKRARQASPERRAKAPRAPKAPADLDAEPAAAPPPRRPRDDGGGGGSARVGRIRAATRGEREATPDQDDIVAGGSDAEDAGLYFLAAAVAASRARDAAAEAELAAAAAAGGGAVGGAAERYGSESDGEGDDAPVVCRGGADSDDDLRLGVVQFGGNFSAYPAAGDRKAAQRARREKARAEARAGKGGAVRPGALAHGGAPAAAAAAAGGGANNTFAALGLLPELVAHLAAAGFVSPTPVQAALLPPLLAGRDALVCAPTGSGKTLAYLAPLIQDLATLTPRVTRGGGTRALVVLPTRELALQVADAATLLARRFVWVVPGAVHGGEERAREKARLRKGLVLLVATPGRLLDHLENTEAFRIAPGGLRWLVLDEADRLLDMGFERKVAEILERVAAREAAAGGSAPGHRRSALLSATLGAGVGRLAGLSLRDPVEIGLGGEGAGGGGAGGATDGTAGGATTTSAQFDIPAQLRQAFLLVPTRLRLVALGALLAARLAPPTPAKAVVFLSNRDAVEFYHAALSSLWEGAAGAPLAPRGAPLLKLHGSMPQGERLAALLAFTLAPAGVLLCTDVAARGLDFPEVTAIIQVDPPGEAAEYVHRVGRTARAGRAGEALLFLLPAERGYVDYLRARGVTLAEARLGPALDAALGGDAGVAAGRVPVERHHGAGDAQRALLDAVAAEPAMGALAAAAFRSSVRAYATHAAELKPFFHVRALHLGHLAAAFALRESPGAVGGGAATFEAARAPKGRRPGGRHVKGGGGGGRHAAVTRGGGGGYVLD
jgi:ATP-dependent RNA helicase DDX31/DBP7